ncbi:MAG: DUF2974 domain-containing protein [Clostridia bacterium]|nr:DUF2974 domain-containing protein [Clostridia bacterium]
MANIFDYLNWRGDLSLDKSEFNEIDNLLLSRFSYCPFDSIMKPDEIVTIKELSVRFEKADKKEMDILQKEDIQLFLSMGNSKRFGEMKATQYINKIDIKEEKQFSAITILMPDNTIYISFRGTDNTIVGWKEDCNMSFKNHLPAQKDAVEYLKKISEMYTNDLRIGGHSKGGNLAVYSAMFASEKIQKRILKIYNNDGPGFNDEIIVTNEYKKIIEKVYTFIPQSSIIGRLLNHQEKYIVLKSKQTGIMQHDLYNWQLCGTKFIYLDEGTNGSKFVNKTIKDWLLKVSPEQREQFIDILFEILNTTQATTIKELKANAFVNATLIFKKYNNVDEESKKIITLAITAFLTIAKDNILEQLPHIKLNK